MTQRLQINPFPLIVLLDTRLFLMAYETMVKLPHYPLPTITTNPLVPQITEQGLPFCEKDKGTLFLSLSNSTDHGQVGGQVQFSKC